VSTSRSTSVCEVNYSVRCFAAIDAQVLSFGQGWRVVTLVKRFRGDLVVRTRRRDGRIEVRLIRQRDAYRYWVSVTEAEYRSGLTCRWVGYLKKLGIPSGRKNGGFHLHSLRHSFETICVNAGIPQRVVDAWIGRHSDRSMAGIYYKLTDEDSQKFLRKVLFGDGKPTANVGH
jgi:integrase